MSVLALRFIGRGRKAARKLSAFLNLPPPVSDHIWSKKTEELKDVCTNICADQMAGCAKELQNSLDTDVPVDTGVTVDGAWQTRGMSSSHGFVTCISAETGKVLDRHYM
jgi:hypothetical protein